MSGRYLGPSLVILKGAETPVMIPANANCEAADLIANIKRHLATARSGLEMEAGGRTQWRSNTMDLAKALLAGRELCQNDNNAFHTWLDDNGLGKDVLTAHERAGLIGIAEHPDIAELVLATTVKRSWKTIWLDEIKPEVDALKRVVTPDNSPRGGRPRKAPTQNNEPVETVVERELVAKCSGSEWRTIDKMSSLIQRAPSSVRDVLKNMAGRELVEQQKGADGVGIEYRITNERDATTPDVEALKAKIVALRQQTDDLEFKVLEKDERITELERLLAEAHAKNDDLKQRIARLEALPDVDRHESIEAEPTKSERETVH
jgi:hypothetical protein